MSRFRAAFLVLQREVIERGRTRSYIISTAIIVVMAVAGIAAIRFVPEFFSEGPVTVGIVAGAVAPEDLDRSAGMFNIDIEVRHYPDRAAGEQALTRGEIGALVAAGEVIFEQESNWLLLNVVAQALGERSFEQRLEEAGLTPEQTQELLAPPQIEVRLLNPREPAGEPDGSTTAVAFVGVIALFIVIMSIGNTVLMGVVEEKTSRVVEVILGAMQPASLLAGKVLGIAALGILQLLAGGIAGVTALLLIAPPDISMPDIPWSLVPLFVAYLVLGIAFYTFAFAAIGATVSRQEEAASAAAPLSFALIGGYMLSITVLIRDPEGTIATLLALVPPFSPIAMPPRLALTQVPAWEVATSLSLMAVATLLVIRLGARNYRATILRVGPRVPLLQALRQSRTEPTA